MEFVTYEVKDRVGIITISREKALCEPARRSRP